MGTGGTTMSAKEYPLSISFEGPGLKADGLPIGELGEAMIAVQRLIYKAYLVQSKQDFVHTSINEFERQKYALQIASRKHGSEHLVFTWLKDTMQDPTVRQLIGDMLVLLGSAATTYVKQAVKAKLDRVKVESKFKNEEADELALRMYPEIQEIVKHIGNPMVDRKPRRVIKGHPIKRIPKPRVDSVRIDIAGVNQTIVFDEKVKEHVKNIENSTRYGARRTIIGKVDKAHVLKGDCIEALIGKEQFWVKLCMKKEEGGTKKKQTKKGLERDKKEKRLFRMVLRHLSNRNKSNEFYFTGRPIYRLGRSLSWYNEFQVDNIEAVQAPNKRPRKKQTAQRPPKKQ